jgi:hypothetical protein
VVRIKGGLAAAPDVRGRGILYVAAETTAGAIATSASGVYTVGDLSPHFIQIDQNTAPGRRPWAGRSSAATPAPPLRRAAGSSRPMWM